MSNDDIKKELKDNYNADIYFDDEDRPDTIKVDAEIFSFSVYAVKNESGSDNLVGFRVKWPEGEPKTWPADKDKLSVPQLVSLYISDRLELIVRHILSENSRDTKSETSFNDLMSQLNNIEPPTKH